MPYIMVNIVSDLIILIYFSLTTAAVLSKYTPTHRYSISPRRRYRPIPFATYSLLLIALLTLSVHFFHTLKNVHIGPIFFFDILFFIAFANSLVLVYQFLNKRWLLRMPTVRRRALIALSSLIMVSVPVVAVSAAVVKIFIIK